MSPGAKMTKQPINFREKLARFSDFWSPRVKDDWKVGCSYRVPARISFPTAVFPS